MAALMQVEGLTFGYEESDPLIDDWSATFVAGEVVAITGPSGRGKSTLLYLLGLMLRGQAGQVTVEGERVEHKNDAYRAALRARSFGFVFQDSALDANRSVLDNITETALYRRQPLHAARLRARELMEQFGVALREKAKPGQVSGGQAQRIALCRALLGDPIILLADEPTGNLDSESAQVVIDGFHAHADKGATVIIVTHDHELVEKCHREIRL